MVILSMIRALGTEREMARNMARGVLVFAPATVMLLVVACYVARWCPGCGNHRLAHSRTVENLVDLTLLLSLTTYVLGYLCYLGVMFALGCLPLPGPGASARLRTKAGLQPDKWSRICSRLERMYNSAERTFLRLVGLVMFCFSMRSSPYLFNALYQAIHSALSGVW